MNETVQPRTELSTDTKKLRNYQGSRKKRCREALKGYHRNTHHVVATLNRDLGRQNGPMSKSKEPTKLSNRDCKNFDGQGLGESIT